MCAQTMIWLSLVGIFNVRTDGDASDCTIAHGGCTDTVRQSALKVDSGRKNPLPHRGTRTCFSIASGFSVGRSTDWAIPAIPALSSLTPSLPQPEKFPGWRKHGCFSVLDHLPLLLYIIMKVISHTSEKNKKQKTTTERLNGFSHFHWSFSSDIMVNCELRALMSYGRCELWALCWAQGVDELWALISSGRWWAQGVVSSGRWWVQGVVGSGRWWAHDKCTLLLLIN